LLRSDAFDGWAGRLAVKRANRANQQQQKAEYSTMLAKLQKERQTARAALHEKRRISSRKSESTA
jgi:hypothetical protein